MIMASLTPISDNIGVLQQSPGSSSDVDESPEANRVLFRQGTAPQGRNATISSHSLHSLHSMHLSASLLADSSETSTVIASQIASQTQGSIVTTQNNSSVTNDGGKFGVLSNATMADVDLVSEAIYPLSKNSQLFTQIKAIKNQAVSSLGAKLLDEWARSLGVKIPRKNKKRRCVWDHC